MAIPRPDKTSRRAVAMKLHAWAVSNSRIGDLYMRMEVPDTVAGRFEMLLLHVFLLIRRARRAGPTGVDIGQALFDTFVADLDGALREMGVGDLAVPKQVQGMIRMFYGRSEALGAALSAVAQATSLADVFRRTVYQNQAQSGAEALADYTIRLEQGLAMASDALILEADLERLNAQVSPTPPREDMAIDAAGCK